MGIVDISPAMHISFNNSTIPLGLRESFITAGGDLVDADSLQLGHVAKYGENHEASVETSQHVDDRHN